MFSPQIYMYLFFVLAEASLYFYMASTYQRRMMDYSWDNHVAIEKYIVTALWVAGIFYSILSISNIYTVVKVETAPYTFHVLISFFNGAKRVLTLGVTVLLSSGRRLSILSSLAGLLYFICYTSVSEYLRYASVHHHHYSSNDESVWVKLWPTSVDILLVGYAWVALRTTIRHIQESLQMRKLQRFVWFSYLLTIVFLLLCIKQISSLGNLLSGAYIVELDQVTFFVLLAGIGALWWPSPANRDYENVVEILPTSADVEREQPLFAPTLSSSSGDDYDLQLRTEEGASNGAEVPVQDPPPPL